MMNNHAFANGTKAVVLGVSLLITPFTSQSQVSVPADTDDEEATAARAEQIARQFEADARILTVFDREGNVLTTVGERGIYRHPVFSPDGKRLVVNKIDLESRTSDLWMFDVATGDGTPITSHDTGDEWATTPVWAPDGTQLVYAALRDGYEGVYRKAATGEGPEELLYRHPGANLWLGDWSMDRRYLSFSASNVFDGTLYALPMDGNGERAPIEVFHSESPVRVGSFSPNARFLSYAVELTDDDAVYVQQFNPSASTEALSSTGVSQVSERGGEFAIRSGWQRGGGELYYVAADHRSIMAAQVDGRATLELEQATLLFRLSQAIPLEPGTINVSRDGEHIVIAVPHAPKLDQIAVFDREGNVLNRVGDPGMYRNPSLSPDGKRVAVTRLDPDTGNWDIWTFDLATGTGTRITNDAPSDNWPIWSPDGSELAYRSNRGMFASIYRKASDGSGREEYVYRHTPGAGLQVTDWSADGRYLTFQDGCLGVLHVLPIEGGQDARDRRSIEWLRDEFVVAQARFSPDSRFVGYLTDEIEPDEFQIYVSPFDVTQPDGGRESAPPIQVSTEPVEGMVTWRDDGEELYYLTPDWEVMAMDVTTTPTFQAGTPLLLFTLPGPLPGNPKQWKSVSPDGERFVFVLNVPVSVR